MSVNRHREDRYFKAEVMLVYRLTRSLYDTHEILAHKKKYRAEIDSIVMSNKHKIND